MSTRAIRGPLFAHLSTRVDALLDVARNPEHTISTVLVHRAVGTAKQRRRVPKSRYPKSIEVGYAQQLVGIVNVARKHAASVMAQVPSLLAAANRQDGGVFLSSELEAIDSRPYRELVTFAGIPVVIENPVGSIRSWTDSDGTTGTTTMKFGYGYIAGTEGIDGEEVDVYLGPDENAPWVYVIHQMKKSSGFTELDEDKVMLGFASPEDAVDAYVAQYDDARFIGGMDAVKLDDFKNKLVARCDGVRFTKRLVRYDAGEASKAASLLADARKRFADAIQPNNLDTLARRFGRATTDAQREMLKAQTRAALGVDLVTLDKKVPAMIDGFVHENVALIKSLGNKTFDDVEKAVTRAFTSGTDAQDLAEELKNQFGIAERHARLIARDQIGKLNGQVTAARHQEIGLKTFTWRTAGDDRVRDEHQELEGQSFPYDDPPSEGLPGEPVLCRCTADPDFDALLDDIDDAENGDTDEDDKDETAEDE